GLDLFFGALAEDESPPDAADRDRERVANWSLRRRATRLGRPLDEAVEVGAHQLDDRLLRDIAGEGHRLVGLVDRQDRADDRVRGARARAESEREEERRRGEPRRALAEVGFVESKGWLPIE